MDFGGQQQQQQQQMGKKKKKGKQQQGGPEPAQAAVGAAGAPAAPPPKVGETSGTSSEGTSTSTPAKQVDPSDWPPALKAYVSRCFNQCVTDVDKDQVEIILKGKLVLKKYRY
jgi:hypothetical protein